MCRSWPEEELVQFVAKDIHCCPKGRDDAVSRDGIFDLTSLYSWDRPDCF